MIKLIIISKYESTEEENAYWIFMSSNFNQHVIRVYCGKKGYKSNKQKAKHYEIDVYSSNQWFFSKQRISLERKLNFRIFRLGLMNP